MQLKHRSVFAFGTRSEMIYFYPYAVRSMVLTWCRTTGSNESGWHVECPVCYGGLLVQHLPIVHKQTRPLARRVLSSTCDSRSRASDASHSELTRSMREVTHGERDNFVLRMDCPTRATPLGLKPCLKNSRCTTAATTAIAQQKNVSLFQRRATTACTAWSLQKGRNHAQAT